MHLFKIQNHEDKYNRSSWLEDKERGFSQSESEVQYKISWISGCLIFPGKCLSHFSALCCSLLCFKVFFVIFVSCLCLSAMFQKLDWVKFWLLEWLKTYSDIKSCETKENIFSKLEINLGLSQKMCTRNVFLQDNFENFFLSIKNNKKKRFAIIYVMF